MLSGGQSSKTCAIFPDVSELGRQAGFQLRFRQLDSGPERVQAEFRRGDRVTLVRMKFDRAYHQRGVPPVGMRTFGIPLKPMRSWLGNAYKARSVLPFDLPDGIDGVSKPGFAACTLSVRQPALLSISKAFRVPIADALATARTDEIIVNGAATQLLRHLILESFEREDSLFDPEREAEIVLTLLRAALADSADVDRSDSSRRARAVSEAIAYITDHRDESVTVAEICRGTGIALRTLNRAFREHFGVGPKAYLIRQRLSDVRSELISAPSGTVIADVANSQGFWHMGQFASDYRRVFGELPSETLASRRV